MERVTDFYVIKNRNERNSFRRGADDGSRTHLIGLGSRSSTDKLHPQVLVVYHSPKEISIAFGRFFAHTPVPFTI